MAKQDEFEMRRLLMQKQMADALSKGAYIQPGEPPAKAWQPVIQQLGGLIQGKRLAGEEQAFRKKYQDTLASALSPVQTPAETLPEGVLGPSRPASSRERTREEVAQELLKNPDTAEMGLKLYLQKFGAPSMEDEAAIKRFKFRQNLPEGDRGTFDQMLRQQQILNLGGQQAVLGPDGNVNKVYPVTPKPEQMPDFQGAQERAKATEKAAVELEAEFAKKGVKAKNMRDLINEARISLVDASSGYAGTGLSAVKGALGVSDPTTQANRKLKLIGGWMVSNVPRMEGPQSDFDVKNYREMAATVGDSTIPVKDRLAALDTLEQLQAKYAGNGTVTSPTGKTNKPNGGIQFLGFE